MRWPKIIIGGAAVILLFSGISIAGHIQLYPFRIYVLSSSESDISKVFYPPVFKIEFPPNTSFSLVDDFQLDAVYIIESKTPLPTSAKIEEIARLQKIAGRAS